VETNDAVEGCIKTLIGKNQVFIKSNQPVDQTKLTEELQKELEYLKGFLASVEKKLSNEKFVQNAKPEVVALEHKKKSDALTKIKMIEESLAAL
jgi:valyl-tRNA synthetase